MTTSSSVRATKRGSSSSKNSNSSNNVGAGGSQQHQQHHQQPNNGVIDMALATLQPLRDLSRNWDVDVASCLDEYLQELAGLHPQQLKNLAERGARATNGNNNNNNNNNNNLLLEGTSTATEGSNSNSNNNININTNTTTNNNNSDVPNFAHAALILQNSSNVYSRKVEYLYSLVYKALDEFFNASSKTAALSSSSSSNNKYGNNRKSKTVDADVNEFFDFDPNEFFMLLDDVVPEDLSVTHRKINLKEDIDNDDNHINGIGGRTGRDRRSSGVSSSGGGGGGPSNRSRNNNNNITRLSLGGLSVTRLERSTAGGALSSTSSSSSSAQQQRALLGILNNGSLRLMAGHCDVGDDGILLMPGSQSSSRPSIGGGGCDADNSFMMTTNNGGGILLDGGDNNNNDQPPGDGIDGGPRSLFGTDNNNVDDNDDDDHDNDGQGFVMNDDYDDHDNDNGGSMDIEETQANVFNTMDGGTSAAPLASSSSTSTKRVAFAESTIHKDDAEKNQHQKKKKVDPWALLDPHSMGDSSYKLKPLKKGKTYRLPDGILQPPSECVTGASTSTAKRNISQPERRSLFAPPTLRPSLAVETYRIAMGKQFEDVVSSSSSSSLSNDNTKISYRGLAYGDEFLYIAKENAKIRAAKRREERKQHQKQNQQQQPYGDSNSNNNNNNNNNGPNYDNDDNYDDDDNNGGGFDFGGGGGDDDHYDDDDDDHDGGDNNDNQNTGNAGLTSLDDAFQRRIDYDDDGNAEGSSDGGQTFEELCRAHIQAFAKSAEKYALTTKLTERISQWQAHLAPILEEEERKASFDIHRYSEMLLESAMASSEENKKKRKQSFGGGDDGGNNEQKQLLDFEIVTRGCTQSDICRMFLASLSLANSGNLKIEEGMDGYQFEIVSDKVENPMETYRAPSTIE